MFCRHTMVFLWKRTYKSGKTVWVIYYRVGKKHRSKVIGETDKRTAERIFRQFNSQLADKDFSTPEYRDILLNEFLDEYFKKGDMLLSEINSRHLREYRNVRLKSISEEIVNLEFRHLKAIFNMACLLNYLRENRFKLIKPLRIPESELPKFLELEQIVQVRKAFGKSDFRYLVEFYLLTGVRLREALSLTRDDVNLNRFLLIVRSVHAKNKHHRNIAFADDEKFQRVLTKRQDGLLFGPKWNPPQCRVDWVSKKISRVLTSIGLLGNSSYLSTHLYFPPYNGRCAAGNCAAPGWTQQLYHYPQICPLGTVASARYVGAQALLIITVYRIVDFIK